MSDAAPNALSELRHDLRTPIGHVLGYSEMLMDEVAESGRADLVADLEKIHAAGERLLAMVAERLSDEAFGTIPAAIASPVVLPVAAQPAPERVEVERDEAERDDAEGGFILIVDDGEDNRNVLARRLQKQGHTVAAAPGGAEALRLLAADAFDVVLLDIMMPDMDGYEVLRRIKADSTLSHTPVIMISALDEMNSVVRCIEMGAADYLPKPFNPTLLKARIGACLREKRAHDREAALFAEVQSNYKRLQELETLRDDLTHMIVHDLRTPLTSLMTGLQTIPLVGDLNDIQQEMVDMGIEGGQTLIGMINDLLDIDKMEAGSVTLDYAELAPAELIARAALQVANLAKNNALTLVQSVAPDTPAFDGDADKLRRVLVNLLGNAIKFTPEGGAITITARPIEGDALEFTVSDTGEGIPPDSFERIFEKFGQVESRKAGRKMSTGLGLTFCKMAVEAHGGRIWVDSTPGAGSVFSFVLPHRKSAH